MDYISYEQALTNWSLNHPGQKLPDYLKSKEAYEEFFKNITSPTSSKPLPSEIMGVSNNARANAKPRSPSFFVSRDPNTGEFVYNTAPIFDSNMQLLTPYEHTGGFRSSVASPNYGYTYNPNNSGAKSAYIDAVISELDSLGLGDFWDSLDTTTKRSIVSSDIYERNVEGFESVFGLAPLSYIDVENLLNDLSRLNDIPVYTELPDPADYMPDSDAIYADIDAYLNPLYQGLEDNLTEGYNAEVAAINDSISQIGTELSDLYKLYNDQTRSSNQLFNHNINALLSQQHNANVGVYDALRSDLRKSRQSALEAGASAGVRIAGNVNAVLSAQNKQSATALETSNQLAQMLLQQRQATMGLYNQYQSTASGLRNSQRELGLQRAGAYSGYMQGLNDLSTRKAQTRSDMFGQKAAEGEYDYNRASANWDYTNRNANDAYANEYGNSNPFAGAHEVWNKNKYT